MMQIIRSSRRAATLVLAAFALSASACSDDEDHAEPEVESMRITVAGQSPITVSSTGVQSGTLNLVQGAATTITVEFLDAANANAITEHADEFQVQVTPAAGSGLTFARTGAFAGTLTGTTAGTRAVALALLHIEENHEDFGPFNVNFNVTAPVLVAAK
jgi:hypothetical protein